MGFRTWYVWPCKLKWSDPYSTEYHTSIPRPNRICIGEWRWLSGHTPGWNSRFYYSIQKIRRQIILTNLISTLIILMITKVFKKIKRSRLIFDIWHPGLLYTWISDIMIWHYKGSDLFIGGSFWFWYLSQRYKSFLLQIQ